MEIIFNIPYRTDRGECLRVFGLTRGEPGDASSVLPMEFNPAEGAWRGHLTWPAGDKRPFHYGYAIVGEASAEIHCAETHRRIFHPADFLHYETVTLRDFWIPPDRAEDVYATAPFRNVIFKKSWMPEERPTDLLAPHAGAAAAGDGGDHPARIRVRMQVAAPCLLPGQTLYLCGEHPILGAWDLQKACPLRPGRYPLWETELMMETPAASFPYKYVLGDNGNPPATWEPGGNRLFPPVQVSGKGEKEALLITDWPFHHPAGPWRGAGIAIPVFSLRTETGMGVGEFSDLRLLADWAKQMEIRLIQLLPVNDTSASGTWRDSYPYSLISVFALHPLYTNLSAMVQPGSALAQEIAEQARRLNESPVVDYEAVMSVKTTLLKRIYDEDNLHFLACPAYEDFFRKHSHWLRPYAAFCCLRNRHKTNDYRQWGSDSQGAPETIARLTDPQASTYREAAFHYYLQYHLHRQLSEAAAYAREQGIILKGDIPIGVSKSSVETWQNPKWFHLDRSAGAPPDFFSEEGQNWGFPTYNWEAMAADGYHWWRRRLLHLHEFFDAVRLDHVIGFFRIWTIPDQTPTSMEGRFYPALPLTRAELEAAGINDIDRFCEPQGSDDDTILIPDSPGDRVQFHPGIRIENTRAFQSLDEKSRVTLHRLHKDYFFAKQEALWKASGLEKLSVLASATDMLICGEDLGMVPHCVPGVLTALNIFSLRIQRMPVALGELFSDPADYPYLSVASPGTHDMSTIRGWWEEEDRAVIQVYFEKVLGGRGVAPQTCEPRICKEILRRHLQSGSMWTIIPVQDLLGMSVDLRHPDPRAERINVPATPHHNWNLRLHRTLEDLLTQDAFIAEVRSMIHTYRSHRID